jgi:outer membrane murein-binding lipoprotein Lpp
MSWVAAAVVGGAVVSGAISSRASKNASNASQQATDATIAEQARQYDQTRADFAPARDLGNAAISDINRLYGRTQSQPLSYEEWSRTQGFPNRVSNSAATFLGRVTGNGSPTNLRGDYDAYVRDFQPQSTGRGNPDMGVFFNSPDYAFNLAEGQKAIDRSLVSRGRGLSGAGVRAGVRYASGLASGEFGNFYNRLASQAGLGQAATGSTAAAGANASTNIGNAYMQNGQNRASAYTMGAQGVNNAVQGGISNYMLMRYLNPSAPTG